MSTSKEATVGRQKITLTLPPDLIRRAKRVAIDADRSVSDMVEQGLAPIVAELERLYGDREK